MKHREIHRTARVGWLRAAVLGANDGIVSTASLVLGVAAAGASANTIMLTGVAGASFNSCCGVFVWRQCIKIQCYKHLMQKSGVDSNADLIR